MPFYPCFTTSDGAGCPFAEVARAVALRPCGRVSRFWTAHCPSWAFGTLVGPFSSLWARSALLCLTASAKSDARRAFVGRIGRSLIACRYLPSIVSVSERLLLRLGLIKDSVGIGEVFKIVNV